MPKKKSAKAKKPVKKKAAKPKAKKAAPKKKAASKKAAPAKKKVVKLAPLATGYKAAANEVALGEVEDYFAKIGVLALRLKDSLNVGDILHVKGHTTDLTQKVLSMQIDHKTLQNAKKGDSVGIKVDARCRKGDGVFRVKV